MGYISPEDFKTNTIGKAYDIDGAYGVQCVDGIKKHSLDLNNACDFTCGNGWAYGLWTCYDTNGVSKYYNKHPFSEVRIGDWVIWNKGSKDCKKSHVGMYYGMKDGKVISYGQNQNGKKAFNLFNVSTNGILGVLRAKQYEFKLPDRGYFTYGDNGIEVEHIDNFFMNKVKGKYYKDYTTACVKAFQKINKLEQDGNIGKITLNKMIEDGFDI